MRAVLVNLGFSLGPVLGASGWLWWLQEAGALRDERIAVLAAAVLAVVLVYVVLDRGRRWNYLSGGVYTGGLVVCGGMIWFEAVRVVLDIGVVRFAGLMLSLDVRSGLLVAGPAVGAIVVFLVWCDLAGRLLARRGDEKKKRAASEVFGTSKLLDRKHMRRLERGQGILLGQSRAGAEAHLVGWPLEGSAVTLAPPRTGKGATIALNYLAPQGRGWSGSTVLVDPRGETWCIVARRRREMGRRVVLLDPFGVVEGHKREFGDKLHLPDVRSRCYNPMDFIRHDPALAPRDINVLLDAFLTQPKGSNDTSSHFYESARAIIGGYMAWVRFRSEPGKRNLQEIHRLLTLPPDERKVLVADMRNAGGIGAGLVRLAAERQMQVGAMEAGSNFSTIANQLSFLNYRS